MINKKWNVSFLIHSLDKLEPSSSYEGAKINLEWKATMEDEILTLHKNYT